MRKIKIRRAFVFFAILIFTIVQSYVRVNASIGTAQFNVHEFSGRDRYETCSLICREGWKSRCDNIVIASGENFPDALSAVPLAVKLKAPILLTERNSLRNCIISEIQRLSPKKAYLIGGTGVISDNIMRTLEGMNIETSRIWGNTRYDTSLKIAKVVGSTGKIFVVSGYDYPDALSVASIAGKEGSPVILSDVNEISSGIRNYINDYHVTGSYLLGGPKVISDRVYYELPHCTRIYGQDRYLTNIKVINKFMDELDLNNAFIASGDNFPDALSSAPMAGLNSAPVILTRVNQEEATGRFFASINSFIKDVYIAGGEAVVPRRNISRISTEPNAINHLNIPTYDGRNQSCHPKVIYFENGWNGWKYWMTMTPYPGGNDFYENASVIVSNSGTDWQVPYGLKNPVAPIPQSSYEHGSDPELVYNQKENRLELWYRYTYRDTGTDEIYRICSYNGVSWSSPQRMFIFYNNQECLSPSIIIENNIYKMWYVEWTHTSGYRCMYMESSDEGKAWSNPVEINLNLSSDCFPWHIDICHTDMGYEMVFSGGTNDDFSLNNRILYYNNSSNGINFGQSKVILRPSSNSGEWDNKQIYRSTFVKVNGIYRLFYSAMDVNTGWHIGLTQGYSFDDLHGYEGDIQQ